MTVDVGTVAPDFSLLDQDGDRVTLSALRGRPVMLLFYPLDFSPICTAELKEVALSAERYAGTATTVLGISVDSTHTHAAFRKSQGLPFPLLSDFHPKGEVARRYGVYFEPAGFANRATFIVDAEGVVRQVVITSPGEARDQEECFSALRACASALQPG